MQLERSWCDEQRISGNSTVIGYFNNPLTQQRDKFFHKDACISLGSVNLHCSAWQCKLNVHQREIHAWIGSKTMAQLLYCLLRPVHCLYCNII